MSREVGVERVLVEDDHEQEEVRDHHQDRDDVGQDLAVPVAVGVDGDGREHRQQEDPPEDRAVEAAPVGGDLVEERRGDVGGALDVLDRIVVGHERVDEGDRRQPQHRGQRIGGRTSRLDESRAPATHPNNGSGRAIGRDDESDEQGQGAESSHGSPRAVRIPRPRSFFRVSHDERRLANVRYEPSMEKWPSGGHGQSSRGDLAGHGLKGR